MAAQLKLKKIPEQVLVITGASSGIGLTTAKMAAERGAIGIIQVLSPRDWLMTPWARMVDRQDELTDETAAAVPV